MISYDFRFNSKLVRLKAAQILRRYDNPGAGFNSKLVRLKDAPVRAAIGYSTPKFQFQTGAIKRQSDRKHSHKRLHCFNSKLVRLKVLVEPVIANKSARRFNSKLVRLKVWRH